jgi:hypothetical protein
MKIIALVLLVIGVVGSAYFVEINARPNTGRQGVKVEAGHDH